MTARPEKGVRNLFLLRFGLSDMNGPWAMPQAGLGQGKKVPDPFFLGRGGNLGGPDA